jgi:hypothetical protein
VRERDLDLDLERDLDRDLDFDLDLVVDGIDTNVVGRETVPGVIDGVIDFTVGTNSNVCISGVVVRTDADMGNVPDIMASLLLLLLTRLSLFRLVFERDLSFDRNPVGNFLRVEDLILGIDLAVLDGFQSSSNRPIKSPLSLSLPKKRNKSSLSIE